MRYLPQPGFNYLLRTPTPTPIPRVVLQNPKERTYWSISELEK